MNGLRISLFGVFRVSDLADRPLTVRARKNRALLAILATAPGRRHSREWLAELLWEGRAEEAARASLRQALSTLRRDLGPASDALEADAEGAWLAPERVEVDLARLHELRDSTDPATAREAGRLVTGPFLEGMELRESAFRDWLEGQRRHAHALAIRMLRRSAFERGAVDPETAIGDLVRCLELEPNDESVHRELMRTYVAAGRSAEALRHYDRLCRTLESELAARPAARTERLAAELRARHAVDTRADPEPRADDHRTRAGSIDNSAAKQPGVRYAVVVCGVLGPPGTGQPADGLEDLHLACDARLTAIEAIVESHGGRFFRRGGTRFLGIFGLEHARGSEVDRALRSVLELQAWHAEQHSSGGDMPALRSVVTTGRVTVEADRVTGGPVKLAEQVVARTTGEPLLIDEPTKRLLEEHAELVVESAGSVDDKPIWRLESLDQRAGAAGDTPFVGRAYELSEIDRALEGTRRDRSAHLVLLRGEAGIGKTRLLQEVADRARALRFEVHPATVLDFGEAEGEGAVATLVRSVLGNRELQRKADVDALVDEGLLSSDQEPFLLDLLDIPQPASMRAVYAAMDTETRRHRQAETVAGLIERRCLDQPVLISVEDIHWADRVTLHMLAELARYIVDRPVVLVLTTRIEGDPIDRGWLAMRRGVPMVTLDLAPLGESDSRAIAAGHGDLPEHVITTCVERSGGNPLFLVQLLLAARDPDSEHVPATIQSLVQVRIDSLVPTQQCVLRVAAVLGQRFRREELDALAEASPDYDALVGSYLVQPEGEAWVFSHALIRDAILESMLAARRRELHAQAARWYRPRDPVLHARHLDAAGDPAAAGAYLEAAHQQLEAFRYERALELLERGIALSSEPHEKSRLLATRGEVLTDAGRTRDAIAVLREAERHASDPSLRCRILIDIAAAMRVTDQIDEALTLLEEAEPLAEQAGLNAELARLCELRGSLDFPRGRLRECLAWQERACRYAQAARSPALEAQALGGLSDAYYALGYLLRAKESYMRCVQMAEENGLGRIAVANRVQIASLHKYILDLDSGLQYANRAIEMARTVGHRRAEMHVHLSFAFLLIETGAVDEVLQHMKCADVLIADLDSKRFMPRTLHYRAKAHQLNGDRELARGLLEQAYRLCRKDGAAFIGPSICAALALATKNRKTRWELLHEARELMDGGALFHNIVEYHRDAIEAALEDGDVETARTLSDSLESAMSHEPTPFTDCLVERARLLARWREGDHSVDTKAALEQLCARLEQRSFDVLAARIHSALADGND